jgi:hypothetical protein
VIAVLSCNLFKPNSSENNKEQLINISEMYHLEIIYFINMQCKIAKKEGSEDKVPILF